MKTLLIILCLVLLNSCSEETSSNPLVERSGVHYEINSEIPYTGNPISYYKNGQLKSKENYKDGNLDGPLEGYYSNGQLEVRGNFKDGRKDGQEKYFDEEGNITKTKEYKDGILQE